jgi:hypothetical protein
LVKERDSVQERAPGSQCRRYPTENPGAVADQRLPLLHYEDLATTVEIVLVQFARNFQQRRQQ